MNVFLPYKSFDKCAEVLDDKRLVKQILECRQILNMIATKKSNQEYKNPYLHHPVVAHYFNQEKHIVDYALAMCREFHYRFNRWHSYHESFIQDMRMYDKPFLPIFAKGNKHDPSHIRETNFDKVCELFKQRLVEKWDNNKQFPNWTKRPLPEFYN